MRRDLLVTGRRAATAPVALGEQVGLEVNREPGFALRHDARITVMQMSGSFMQERPAGWAYAMQALGLRIAGAQVQGPLFADACDVVPRAQTADPGHAAAGDADTGQPGLHVELHVDGEL